MSEARVLVVTTDDELRDRLRRDLADAGHRATAATDVPAAIAAAADSHPAVVLADVRIAAGLAQELAEPVVIALAPPRAALPEGVWDLLRVPCDAEELAARVGAALELQRLRFQVGRDDVTGLPGRDRAVEELARVVAAARRHGRPVAALLADIDDFGSLGREHGRAGAESVLRETGLRLAATLRAGDLAARIGGDLFLVILADAPAEQVALIGDRLRRSIEAASFRPGETPTAVTVSVGWAAWQGEEPQTLLGRADEALLAAKAAGGNAVHPLA